MGHFGKSVTFKSITSKIGLVSSVEITRMLKILGMTQAQPTLVSQS